MTNHCKLQLKICFGGISLIFDFSVYFNYSEGKPFWGWGTTSRSLGCLKVHVRYCVPTYHTVLRTVGFLNLRKRKWRKKQHNIWTCALHFVFHMFAEQLKLSYGRYSHYGGRASRIPTIIGKFGKYTSLQKNSPDSKANLTEQNICHLV